MSLLEAMSHGCLCLTSDIPENRDVLNGAGLMFEKGSVESLRAALEGALAGPHGALKAAARRRVRSFGWDDVTRRTIEIYRKA